MIVALEGPSYSGKSTMANIIRNRIPHSLVIDEYHVFAGGAKNFPPLAKNAEDGMRNIKFFLDLEQKRQRSILAALESGLVILDRSHLTCIAFEYAMCQMGIYDIWQEAERQFNAADLIKPDMVVLLNASQSTIEYRHSKDSYNIPAILVDSDFNKFFTEYFLMQASKKHAFHTVDANQTVDNVFDEICQTALAGHKD